MEKILCYYYYIPKNSFNVFILISGFGKGGEGGGRRVWVVVVVVVELVVKAVISRVMEGKYVRIIEIFRSPKS